MATQKKFLIRSFLCSFTFPVIAKEKLFTASMPAFAHTRTQRKKDRRKDRKVRDKIQNFFFKICLCRHHNYIYLATIAVKSRCWYTTLRYNPFFFKHVEECHYVVQHEQLREMLERTFWKKEDRTGNKHLHESFWFHANSKVNGIW